MYKFGKIEVPSKTFNTVYQAVDISTIDLEKIRISEGVVANKHGIRLATRWSRGRSPLSILRHREIVSLQACRDTTRALRGIWALT